MIITRKLALVAGTAIAVAGAAHAQSSQTNGTPSSEPMTEASAQSASDVTCAEFLVLDTPAQGAILMPIMPASQNGAMPGGSAEMPTSGGTESSMTSSGSDVGTSDTTASDLGAEDLGDPAEGTPSSSENPDIGTSDTTASTLGAGDDAGTDESGTTAEAMASGTGTDMETGAGSDTAATDGETDMASGSGTVGAGAQGTDTAQSSMGGQNATHLTAVVEGVFQVCAEDSEQSVQDAMNSAAEDAQTSVN